MKKTGFIIKLIASIAIIILGIIVMMMGTFNNAAYYYGVYTSYEYYGGDAYTGIQQAVADTSKNVDRLGDLICSVTNNTYLYAGLIIIALGIYMIGNTFANFELEKKETPKVEPVVNPSQDDVLSTITKFKELLDAGAITQEEFDAKKKEMLNI